MDKQQLISGLFDAFTSAVSSALAETGPEDIRVSWALSSDPQNDTESWTWWSGGLSAHPGAKFFLGAPQEAWEKLGRGGASGNTQEDASALISGCFSKAVEEQFGNRSSAQDGGLSDAPPAGWARVAIEIRYPAGEWPAIGCVLSQEFEAALEGSESQPAAPLPVSPVAGRTKTSDMLMQVQVPVSVSFGATQIRMKDLLNLTAGSVVELDQALQDSVEVRVNDRVIARGEVVAVDGNYGVRVLELVSGESSGGAIGL